MIYKCKVDFEKEILRYERLLSNMDNERKAQIDNLVQVNDKIRTALSRKLMEFAICDFAKLSPSELSFGKGQYGKPKLLSHPKTFFNISHSNDWTVCAVDVKPVGIDIEKIVDFNSGTLEMFCSASECNVIKASQSPKLKYYQYWTIKEATLKLIGTGLLTDPRNVTVSFLEDHLIKVNLESNEWMGESICTDAGYALTALNTNEISDTVLVSADEFYK